MTIDALATLITSIDRPVILLEGTRSLPEADRGALVDLSEHLARAFPHAIFRTGNATGSDEAFAEGVNRVAPERLQYIVPHRTMGSRRRAREAYTISMEDVPKAEEPVLAYKTKQATPATAGLVGVFEKNIRNNAAYARSLYLLRDTLKVVGSDELGLDPATVGIFYVNRLASSSGGTGHTINVCHQHAVPVVTQEEWIGWF